MDPFLYEAATSGDVGFLRDKINSKNGGVSSIDLLLHQKTPKDNNILHISAESKQIDFFKNVDPDRYGQLFWAPNKKGNTPLHVASRVGCVEIVNLLIQNATTASALSLEGADEESGLVPPADKGDLIGRQQLLRMTNLQKDTAMHVAVRSGHHQVVLLLMESDPQLCCFTNSANESPLFLATLHWFPPIACSILNQCPISPSFQGTNGLTSLHVAAARTGFGDQLMDKVQVDQHQGLKASEISVTDPHGLVKIMVSKNPGMMKEVDTLGWTPLHYAALWGNSGTVSILLQADSSASYILDKSGLSALHVAAYAGHTSIMEEVIRCRPDTCDLLNHKGQTVLHAAVLGGQTSVVEYILKTPKFAGLIDEADADGNTPLHLSAIYKEDGLREILTNDPRVNKSALNDKLYTAFDILLQDHDNFTQVFDTSIDPRSELIGPVKSIGMPFLQEQILHHIIELEPTDKERSSEPAIADKKEKPLEDTDEELWKKFDTNLLIATLIATVTFTAAFTMPGGLKDDGTPVLQDKASFQVFLLFDSLSFILSIFVVLVHLITANLAINLQGVRPILIHYSVVGMNIAFASALFAMLPKGTRWLGILACVTCGFICLVATLMYYLQKRRREKIIKWMSYMTRTSARTR
ncbi:ankyrin repeat-containing protein [Pyrus ussuriensis x Pyrus communis]|uniref:Ankyrin repeat-containing protein n=1 Tax=Pyrus ussuriensis x Pyrus communis TaxID=2448454 RepID=A0A5N5FPL4_9ROSA|nr:ankyrin repeat-containing protein [Pyrus ussuriensis x Pyrus communis]